MSTLEIVDVDPDDRATFDAWHAVYAEATRHDQGEHATVWALEEVRAMLAERSERHLRLGWAGLLDGRVVATGTLGASLVDNLGSAEVMVTTAPADRRHGHAAAMLARVEDAARGLGRTHLLAEVSWAYDDPDGGTSGDLRWARAHGFEIGLVDVQRRLPLPVDPALLDELADATAPHHEGYELRSFVGPVPDDLVEDWAVLSASLVTEAPMGEIRREAESADVAALRAGEALVAQQGRTKVNTAAVSADGEVVAYTDLAVTEHESDRAYQWGTLVRADHRGHRLGMAVKLANLRLLQETQPQIRTVVTFNAEVNAHMVGVNEQLGYVAVQRMGELQKVLTGG